MFECLNFNVTHLQGHHCTKLLTIFTCMSSIDREMGGFFLRHLAIENLRGSLKLA
jgi:hypothetical protein